ncbi:hypothetical protein A0H81_04940 [Grifola frondosa]|uniref:Uncharacterized protein n=1 Tax=Grifola frondosa TaxID=5627 RepID=A0A1C7MES2_GRIFR|nr:hypothetical protein A0H81_04940 [Grifola frondosa]
MHAFDLRISQKTRRYFCLEVPGRVKNLDGECPLKASLYFPQLSSGFRSCYFKAVSLKDQEDFFPQLKDGAGHFYLCSASPFSSLRQ